MKYSTIFGSGVTVQMVHFRLECNILDLKILEYLEQMNNICEFLIKASFKELGSDNWSLRRSFISKFETEHKYFGILLTHQFKNYFYHCNIGE